MTNSSSQAPSLEEQRQLFGQQIKSTREFRRLTLHSLAAEAEVGVQTLVRIEKGDKGVGLLNLQSVAQVLGMAVELTPRDMPPAELLAKYPLHVEQDAVLACVDDAVTAAVAKLDRLFGKGSERNAIAPAVQRQLRAHVLALLAGRGGASDAPSSFVPLVYSGDDLGGPLTAPAGQQPVGWVLRMRGGVEVLQSDGSLVGLDAGIPVDVWASRREAVLAFFEFVARAGHPPGLLDASPVYHDEQGAYRY